MASTRQKTPEKMLALYNKYKESGLIRGEIRKPTTKPKSADAPVNLDFVTSLTDRLDNVMIDKLAAEHKTALSHELVRLRGVINLKMKHLKA